MARGRWDRLNLEGLMRMARAIQRKIGFLQETPDPRRDTIQDLATGNPKGFSEVMSLLNETRANSILRAEQSSGTERDEAMGASAELRRVIDYLDYASTYIPPIDVDASAEVSADEQES